MKKLLICALLISIAWGSAFSQVKSKRKKNEAENYNAESFTQLITPDELNAHLQFVASDFTEGRKVGTKGELTIALYIATQYMAMGISPVQKSADTSFESYFQSFPFSVGNNSGQSQNVLAFIEGSDPVLKNEVIILSSHYDHLGIGEKVGTDSIFNGAADDGSGTVALLEIAESFIEAKRNGLGLKRSLLFLHTGGEESGLLGSTYYVGTDPIIPLGRVTAVINLDGVGGTDKPTASNSSNYVYLLRNDSTSLPIAQLAERINKSSRIGLDILQPSNPNRFNSDNKPFEYELIPALYFSTGLTEHYHQVTDNPNTINYEHMVKITRLIFSVCWELGNTQWPAPVVKRSQFKKTNTFFCPPCGCQSDAKVFDKPGICPDCGMPVQPTWTKK